MWTLLISLALANPCGTPDCPVVADLDTVTDPSPAAPWSELTRVQPGDFAQQGLRPDVMELALAAFSEAWARGDTQRRLLTVIDYSMHSSEERMWVIDLETGALLYNTWVAHGQGSGVATAEDLSNTPESHKSNVGLMITAGTYTGKHGRSLYLHGMEPGFNDNAYDRSIVMHTADYVSQAFIDANGRLGRSHGCPALSHELGQQIIDTIMGGTVVFGYAPVRGWLEDSTYLGERGDAAAANLPPPTLQRGDDGADVERLQEALAAAGYYDGTIDGDFGRGTRRAVQALQRTVGLNPDGVVGPDTWAALES
jgi:hypothetical protein